MSYVFNLGPVAITSEYWEETYPNGAFEGGARVEVRRSDRDQLLEPVWRADLFSLMGGKPGSHDRAHFHQPFRGWAGGARHSSPQLRANPIGWTMDRLNELAVTLREAQAGDLADRIDQTELHALLPDVRHAIERCMQPPEIDEPCDSPILVPIRASGSGTPLFFLTFSETGIPGLRAIAEILGNRRPLYGGAVNRALAAQPEVGAIQDLAEVFFEEIRKARPEGPYLLAGNSVGGLVAYEVASRLRERGEDVPLLVLVDTVALNSLPASSRVRMARKSVRAALLRYLPDPFRSSLRWTRARIRGEPPPRAVHRSPSEQPLKLRSPRYGHRERALLNMVGRYRPRPYPGRMALFRTKLTPLLFEDSELGWGRLARAGFDIEEVSGFHGGLMRQPYVAALGETLARRLDRAGV